MQTATSEASPPSTPARGRWLTGELWLALEVAALTAFAFSRPVLDSFGRSPETLQVRKPWPRCQIDIHEPSCVPLRPNPSHRGAASPLTP